MKTDFELRHDVERELEWDPSVDARDIAITARNGVVTLTGHVPTLGEKWRAESIAKRVAGVVALANEIEVELLRERTDADIAEDLRLAFKMDNRIPAESIKVIVSNGWVTLEGTVNHYFQKAEAENLARELAGVRGITNSIVVAPSASPREVKAMIEDALKRSAQLDANRISVETHNGKVILTGTVRSFAERGEAEGSLARAGRYRGGKQADRQAMSLVKERECIHEKRNQRAARGGFGSRHASTGLQPEMHAGPIRFLERLSRPAADYRVLSRRLEPGVRRSVGAVQRGIAGVQALQRRAGRHLRRRRVVPCSVRQGS